MKNIRLLTVVTVLVCFSATVGAGAAQNAADLPQGSNAAQTPTPATYVLGPDDQIVIQATDAPDISGKPLRLDPNGDLRLPMVGRIRAAGMTMEQLEAELTNRLTVYLRDPDVSVSVTEFNSQPVSVIGAVGSSGVHQLAGRKTLIEVLALAGGIRGDAGPSVKITRRLEWGSILVANATRDTTGTFSIAEIDLKSLFGAESPEKNIIIRPFDVISVPTAEVIYVVGEVSKPGALALSGGHSISIMEAVSSSGGVLRTAAPNKARILRRVVGDSKRAELNVDLKKIMQGKDDDVALFAGDILVVPDSSGKRVTARVIEAIISTGTTIGTYGIVR